MADPYAKPLPAPTPHSEPFWAAARDGALQMQWCARCDAFVFYPRGLCPGCWSNDLEWRRLSGRGSVFTYTVAHHPTHPAFADDVPFVIAVVELDEGPRMTTSIVGCAPDEVHIGLAVEAVFDGVTPETTLVKFRPRAGGG